jgi:hypothetical protein
VTASALIASYRAGQQLLAVRALASALALAASLAVILIPGPAQVTGGAVLSAPVTGGVVLQSALTGELILTGDVHGGLAPEV